MVGIVGLGADLGAESGSQVGAVAEGQDAEAQAGTELQASTVFWWELAGSAG